MEKSLGSLQADVRDLGRCLNNSAYAVSKLQEVQKRINDDFKKNLSREKRKMSLKNKKISELQAQLEAIEKNQSALICGHKAYRYGRFVLLLVIVWAIVMSALYGSV